MVLPALVETAMKQAALSDNRELHEALRQLEQQHARLLNEIAELQRKLGYEELLPLKMAAAEVGYNQETVRLWFNKALVAGERRGGRVFIDFPSLQEYCASVKTS